MNVAVIGTGNMGKHHIRVYSELPDVKLVAICDINKELGLSLAKAYNTKFYNNFESLLKLENIDAVSICVPTSSHFKVAKVCLMLGKHVLLEKPITLSPLEGKKLIDLAKKKGLTFLVGHIERYNPAVTKVKEMITKGTLGELTAIVMRRVGGFPPQIRDANIAVDLAIHDIDIANYLIDAFPEKISINKQKHLITDREDTVEMFLTYKKTSVYIQANWISPVKIRKLTITGTKGYLEMDYITQQIDFYKSNHTKFKQASKNFSNYLLLFSEPDKINIPVEKREPLKEELAFFTHAVAKKLKPNQLYAVKALEIALKK